jgi:Bacterial archaeo-eukaryotic release factor family 10
MITYGELDKLRSVRAPEETVLSLYINVPMDPGALREMSARADDLIGVATRPAAIPRTDDPLTARDAVAAHARGWPGHTLAIFVCGDLGLLEVVPLPGTLCERAVWDVRPHVRPLLAALQRHPDYRIAVIDRRHAWLLAVTPDGIATVGSTTADGASAGGWHGLQGEHLQRHVRDLTRHHYRDAATLLEQAVHNTGPQPVVLGGHADSIKHLLAAMTAATRSQYVGCFAADPHVLTPAKASELAEPVIAHRAELQERQVVSELTGPTSGARAAIGLNGCLAAVNAESSDLLLLPDDGVVPGYHCERCGVLSVTGEECCDWGAASRAVPDLLEEMARRVLADDGEVFTARGIGIDSIAARLRQVG